MYSKPTGCGAQQGRVAARGALFSQYLSWRGSVLGAQIAAVSTNGTQLFTATSTMAVADSIEGIPVWLAAPYGKPSCTAPSASFSITSRRRGVDAGATCNFCKSRRATSRRYAARAPGRPRAWARIWLQATPHAAPARAALSPYKVWPQVCGHL